MKRGSLITISGGADYAGKPRPMLIVQSDLFGTVASLTVCPLTSRPITLPLLRIGLSPSPANGLAVPSWIMIDKIQALPRTKVGRSFGEVTAEQMLIVTEALAIFLGIAERQAA